VIFPTGNDVVAGEDFGTNTPFIRERLEREGDRVGQRPPLLDDRDIIEGTYC